MSGIHRRRFPGRLVDSTPAASVDGRNIRTLYIPPFLWPQYGYMQHRDLCMHNTMHLLTEFSKRTPVL